MRKETGARHGDLHQGLKRESLEVGAPPSDKETQTLFGHLFGLRLDPFIPSGTMLEKLAAEMSGEDQGVTLSRDSLIPAGYTILGQFITHDLTHDTSPLDGRLDDPPLLKNHRTPKFDLDSVYAKSPFLAFAPERDETNTKMRYRPSPGNGEPDDLLRYGDIKKPEHQNPPPDERAIIGDLRNDENVLISQLHLAFLKLHNRFVDRIREFGIDGERVPEERVFDEARRLCRWHYQWVVVNDYLPRIVGEETVHNVLKPADPENPAFGFRLYGQPDILPPTMPVEFSAAAFRLGHSMVRTQYHVNKAGTIFPVFDPSEHAVRHLGGGRRLPAQLVVDWARFFKDLPQPPHLAADRPLERNFAMKIDATLTDLLALLPKTSLPPGDSGPRSLAHRDLLRGIDLGLPSGQAVAQLVLDRIGGFEILSKDVLGLQKYEWDGDAPLWFYILKEADEMPNGGVSGEQLGPVGGRIVAEVILGLMRCDDESYLNKKPDFAPDPGDTPGNRPFSMADLLILAGVTPGSS